MATGFNRDDAGKTPPPAAGVGQGAGADDAAAADADGREDVSATIKRTRRPKSRGRRRPAGRPAAPRPPRDPEPEADAEPEPDEARKAVFLAGGFPRVVAKLYARVLDLVALLTLAGLSIPARYYERPDLAGDADLWAQTVIAYSFDVMGAERAEKAWRLAALLGLPAVNVADAILAARERYESAAGDPRPSRLG